LENIRLEQILTLGGFVLLLLNRMGRRRNRGKQDSGGGAGLGSWWRRYGDFVALGMVAAGLVGLVVQK
jgi:hypothetical protein